MDISTLTILTEPECLIKNNMKRECGSSGNVSLHVLYRTVEPLISDTDLKKTDCSSHVAPCCQPWSHWPATIVHFIPAYSKSFSLAHQEWTEWSMLLSASWLVYSTLQEHYYKWVFRGSKTAAAWLHWYTSFSGLSFLGLWIRHPPSFQTILSDTLIFRFSCKWSPDQGPSSFEISFSWLLAMWSQQLVS